MHRRADAVAGVVFAVRSDRLMWAIVPLKSPDHAKSRLSAMLPAEARRRLYFSMARRVLGALLATRGIDRVAVVTASAEVDTFARRLGVGVIRQRDDAGMAGALAQAIEQLRAHAPVSLLMVAGDLPLASPAAFERLIEAQLWPGVVAVPDRHGQGTNALLCSPFDAIAPHFGPDSLHRHIDAAHRAGLPCAVRRIEALALDLDVPDDLAALRASTTAGEAAWITDMAVAA